MTHLGSMTLGVMVRNKTSDYRDITYHLLRGTLLGYRTWHVEKAEMKVQAGSKKKWDEAAIVTYGRQRVEGSRFKT